MKVHKYAYIVSKHKKENVIIIKLLGKSIVLFNSSYLTLLVLGIEVLKINE